MTTVSPTTLLPSTSNTSSTSSTSSTSASTAVNYNEFLQLLVAELQNQDPTSPTNPTQYMSQLASFSQVEQQVQTNTTLSAMLTSSTLSQADSLIGKSVTSADGNTSGTVASVSIASNGTATATLADGSTIALANGITISNPTTSQ
jgi:flagellar basal-body rod modification protein FlgD